MIFEKLKADKFGCLSNWQTPRLDNGLVVIFGLNESGKSTIFNLIITILYGFTPASRDTNPYIPWQHNKAVCQASIKMDNGQIMDVTRKLQSSAAGNVVLGDKSINIGNKPLYFLNSLSRKVFEQVYTLNLDNMSMPQNRTWEMMQNQLLGGDFYSFIRPVTDVSDELEREANSLWRYDRRGKPKSKQIQNQLKQLNMQKSIAMENERVIKDSQRQLEQLNSKLNDLYKQKALKKAYIEKCEKLYPAFKKLDKIYKLLSQTKQLHKFDLVPDDAKKELHRLDEQISRFKKDKIQFEKQLKKLMQQTQIFTQQDKILLEKERDIEYLIKCYQQVKWYLDQKDNLKTAVSNAKHSLIGKADEILEHGWKDGIEQQIINVDTAKLKSCISLYKKLDDTSKMLKLQLAQVKGQNRQLLPWACVFITLCAFIGLFLYDRPFLNYLFVTVMLLGSVCLTVCTLGGRTCKSSDNIIKDELKAVHAQKEQLLSDIKENVKDIAIPKQRLSYPDDSLLIDIKDLKDYVLDYMHLSERLDEIDAQLKKFASKISDIFKYCNLGQPSGNMLNSIDFLEHSLRQAQKNHKLYSDAQRDIQQLLQQKQYVQEELQCLEASKKELVDCINQMQGESIDQRIQNILNMRDYKRQADILMQELEQEYTDIQQIKQLYINRQKVDIDEQMLAEAKVDIERIEQQINDINSEIGKLKKQIEHGLNQKRLDEIEGEILHLKQSLYRVAFERDRLMLAKNIINKAQERFREQHQPDVLKKSGRYISIITSGKYDRIYAENASDRILHIRMRTNGQTMQASEYNFSRGTLEQIYFALKLAMAEHLDADSESIPIILDDIFVNWDEVRVEKSIHLLRTLCKQRQVFLLTCHKWLVDVLLSHMDAQLIRL